MAVDLQAEVHYGGEEGSEAERTRRAARKGRPTIVRFCESMAGSVTDGRSLWNGGHGELRSDGECASSSGRNGSASRNTFAIAGSEYPATAAASEASKEATSDL